VLLIQDEHVVMGREELPFEDAYRSKLTPRIAEDEGTRLAAFLWAPHGAGLGYEAVTLTALRDVEALGRHQDRLATGDLAELWLSLEAKQRSLASSLHVIADWCPLGQRPLSSFASGEEPTALFRLDSFTVAGPVSAAVDVVSAQLERSSADDAVTIVGCWSPFLGDLATPVVSVLSRLASNDALRAAFVDPSLPWSGAPAIPGARRQTRLLRSASWSAVH
jgi:hypothetical protein